VVGDHPARKGQHEGHRLLRDGDRVWVDTDQDLSFADEDGIRPYARNFEVDTFGFASDIEVYKAFKRSGICAPRVDGEFGTFFQSSVTSDLNAARVEIYRRKFADLLLDTFPTFAMKYCKKLNKQDLASTQQVDDPGQKVKMVVGAKDTGAEFALAIIAGQSVNLHPPSLSLAGRSGKHSR
jgi:hypothetical protein